MKLSGCPGSTSSKSLVLMSDKQSLRLSSPITRMSACRRSQLWEVHLLLLLLLALVKKHLLSALVEHLA